MQATWTKSADKADWSYTNGRYVFVENGHDTLFIHHIANNDHEARCLVHPWISKIGHVAECMEQAWQHLEHRHHVVRPS